MIFSELFFFFFLVFSSRPGPMDFWFELAVNSIRIASQVVYEDEPLPEELAPPAPPALPTESAAQNATSEVKT